MCGAGMTDRLMIILSSLAMVAATNKTVSSCGTLLSLECDEVLYCNVLYCTVLYCTVLYSRGR